MSTINGTSESETLTGTDGVDRIYTRGGLDIVYGGDGDDEINGYLTNVETNRWMYWTTADSLLVQLSPLAIS
jgi:Ca2+-binding RTX toxin-like protein